MNDAVPLNKNSIVQVSQSESEEIEKDFWPEGEEDENVDEIELELTAALAEVEGIHREFVPLASSSAGLKRKYVEETKGTSTKIRKHVSKVWEATAIKRFGSFDFEIDEQGYVIVYTDGSCFGNGTDKACAGFGVYFGEDHPLNTAKPVIGRVTNNVGEIQAAIYAIKVAHDIAIPKLCISTDSQFLINAITLWVRGWKRNNWQLKSGGPVKNVTDFRELDELIQKGLTTVKWNYVNAHKGIKGNEMADKLAREGSILYKENHSKK
ncbi:ribonuclease H1 isoform X2 [Teleopsis dalmanni]|nr:ribonuclease H1 isoform X2 [Teleopsis dalmanni]